MIPEIVKFTNHTVDPRLAIYGRKLRIGPVPPEWFRLEFQANAIRNPMDKVDRWIAYNSVGRWFSYTFEEELHKWNIIVLFELDDDAVMMKISGNAWENFDPNDPLGNLTISY